jgi:hypothetical protein
MLQFTQKLRRLETMKISNFAGSVLVAFVAVGLPGTQQVQAQPILTVGRIGFSGFATLSKNPMEGTSTLVFDSVMTTFGNGVYAKVLDGTKPSGFDTPEGTFDTLSFHDDTLQLVGEEPIFLGFWELTDSVGQPFQWILGQGQGGSEFLSKGSIVTLGAPTWSFSVSGGGEASGAPESNTNTDFTMSGSGNEGPRVPFTATFVARSSVPDAGTTVALFGMALAGLEGLRRKLATRQNRYA